MFMQLFVLFFAAPNNELLLSFVSPCITLVIEDPDVL